MDKDEADKKFMEAALKFENGEDLTEEEEELLWQVLEEEGDSSMGATT
jgi:hypothetical protein